MQRYGIHLEGKRGHQRGCRRYPEGASDFRPQQIGQVHAFSLSLHYKRASRLYFAEQRAMKTSSYVHFLLRPVIDGARHCCYLVERNSDKSIDEQHHYLIQNCNISSNFFFFFWKNSQLNQDIPCKYREILWNGGKVGEWEIYDRSACHSPVHSFKWD